MTSVLKINSDADSAPNLQAITNDIAALKRDLAALVGSMKSEVTEDVANARSAVGNLGDEAMRAYENFVAQGKRSVKAIDKQVEEQPVISLLLAFAAGFIGSRLLSR